MLLVLLLAGSCAKAAGTVGSVASGSPPEKTATTKDVSVDVSKVPETTGIKMDTQQFTRICQFVDALNEETTTMGENYER